jgi:hypothetical protein
MKCPICCTEIALGEEHHRWGPEWAHARCVVAYNIGKEDANAALLATEQNLREELAALRASLGDTP